MNHKAEVKEWAVALVLKRLRYRETGSKQYELADKLNMSRQYYGKLENARVVMTKSDQENISAYFGISEEELELMIKKEIRILTGKEKEKYAMEKIDYVKIRDEKFHNE